MLLGVLVGLEPALLRPTLASLVAARPGDPRGQGRQKGGPEAAPPHDGDDRRSDRNQHQRGEPRSALDTESAEGSG